MATNKEISEYKGTVSIGEGSINKDIPIDDLIDFLKEMKIKNGYNRVSLSTTEAVIFLFGSHKTIKKPIIILQR